uniref:Coiled-coil domain-containing protein n=1 Tax=Cyclophora tenuis TaxID=216820 RepID=A0A7S1D7G3_CYCTE
MAAEEAELGSGGKVKVPGLSKKGKKKNDLSLLEDALVSEAEKKSKSKKRADQLRKEKEAEIQKRKQSEEEPVDPLLQNTNQMLSGAVGREANKEAMESASGLDAALHSLDVGAASDVKRRKALYLAFEEKMLPVVKEENPGLRLTQYKEKIFNLWKKSPENPANRKDV